MEQLAPESTFRAGGAQRQLAFPTTEHRRKVNFLEAQTQCATQFHNMQADLLERAQAAAQARGAAFAVWAQDQWEALRQVKEDTTAMYERDEVSREARFQDLVQRFRRGGDRRQGQ